MRIFLYLGLVLVLGAIGYQLYRLNGQRLGLERQAAQQGQALDSLNAKQQQLESDLNYFANPLNRLKELKSTSDYKKPGEKLLKIVPTEPGPAPEPKTP